MLQSELSHNYQLIYFYSNESIKIKRFITISSKIAVASLQIIGTNITRLSSETRVTIKIQ